MLRPALTTFIVAALLLVMCRVHAAAATTAAEAMKPCASVPAAQTYTTVGAGPVSMREFLAELQSQFGLKFRVPDDASGIKLQLRIVQAPPLVALALVLESNGLRGDCEDGFIRVRKRTRRARPTTGYLARSERAGALPQGGEE